MNTDTELSPSALRIADVAQALVQQVGFNGFSFEHISQSVGMRKASIHHHFPTKVVLGVAVVKRYTLQFADALGQIDRQLISPHDRLLAYADLFEKTFVQDHRLCLCGMLGAESTSLDQALNTEVRRFFELNLSWLQSAFQDGLNSGAWRQQHTAQDLAETLLSLLEGAMLVGRSISKPIGPRRACEVFLAGVTA
jgi:TetR/AcrR family transcriptional repressor of nem operon